MHLMHNRVCEFTEGEGRERERERVDRDTATVGGSMLSQTYLD